MSNKVFWIPALAANILMIITITACLGHDNLSMLPVEMVAMIINIASFTWLGKKFARYVPEKIDLKRLLKLLLFGILTAFGSILFTSVITGVILVISPYTPRLSEGTTPLMAMVAMLAAAFFTAIIVTTLSGWLYLAAAMSALHLANQSPLSFKQHKCLYLIAPLFVFILLATEIYGFIRYQNYLASLDIKEQHDEERLKNNVIEHPDQYHLKEITFSLQDSPDTIVKRSSLPLKFKSDELHTNAFYNAANPLEYINVILLDNKPIPFKSVSMVSLDFSPDENYIDMDVPSMTKQLAINYLRPLLSTLFSYSWKLNKDRTRVLKNEKDVNSFLQNLTCGDNNQYSDSETGRNIDESRYLVLIKKNHEMVISIPYNCSLRITISKKL